MARLRSSDGFTLIELLVVILIIGILAAIALPRFIRQSDKAKDTQAMSLARDLEVHAKGCYLETSDWDRCNSDADIPNTGLTWGAGAGEVQLLTLPGGIVAFAGTSKTGTTFALVYGATGPTQERICLVPSRVYPTGSCRAGGPIPGFGRW